MQDGTISIHVDNLKRQRGDKSLRSAIERASYISGTKLWCDQHQKACGFDHRNDVVFSAIFAPAGAADWVYNREILWNRVDAAAKRKDARLAKTIIGSIARQITPADREIMVAEFAVPFVELGCVVDVAIHEDGTNHNPHIHVMMTVSTLLADGFGKKINDVERKKFVTSARERWTALNNKYLAKVGSSLRLDHRSYKKRGIGLEPTRHRGPNTLERQARREHARAVRTQPQPERTPQPPLAANAAMAALPPLEPVEHTMRQPTDAERRDYPHLSERKQWPPPLEPVADMDRATRSELRRYWDEHKIERIEAERLIEAATPEQQYPSGRKSLSLRRERSEAQEVSVSEIVEKKRRSFAPLEQQNVEPTERVAKQTRQFAEDLVFETEVRERKQREHDDLYRRATNMNRTREESELLELARVSPPETAQYIKDTILFRRMEKLQAEDQAKRDREFERKLDPRVAEKIAALNADYEQDWRSEIVQGPDYAPLHQRERDVAEEKMLAEIEREVEKLPEQYLGDHLDHAHATRKMVKDMERKVDDDPLARLRDHVLNREHEQERER